MILTLTPTEKTLFAALIEASPRVLSHDDMWRRCGDDYVVNASVGVHTHVNNIRAKLRTAGYDSGMLMSIYSRGYAWRPDKRRLRSDRLSAIPADRAHGLRYADTWPRWLTACAHMQAQRPSYAAWRAGFEARERSAS